MAHALKRRPVIGSPFLLGKDSGLSDEVVNFFNATAHGMVDRPLLIDDEPDFGNPDARAMVESFGQAQEILMEHLRLQLGTFDDERMYRALAEVRQKYDPSLQDEPESVMARYSALTP
ncbi:MAG: hypothetical protein ACLFP8_05520 [Alphaproteobacteria bacterium]